MSTQQELPRTTRELIDLCREQNWDVGHATNGHWKIRPPGGETIFYSGTTSDCNSVLLFRSKLKRAGLLPKLEYLEQLFPRRSKSESSPPQIHVPPQMPKQAPFELSPPQPTPVTETALTAAQQILEDTTKDEETSPMPLEHNRLRNVIVKVMKRKDPQKRGLLVSEIAEDVRATLPKTKTINVGIALAGYAKRGSWISSRRDGKYARYFLVGDVQEDLSLSESIKQARAQSAAERVKANGGEIKGARTGDAQTDEDLAALEAIGSAFLTLETDILHELELCKQRIKEKMRVIYERHDESEKIIKRNRALIANLLQVRASLNNIKGI